jgi:hypothetical protein
MSDRPAAILYELTDLIDEDEIRLSPAAIKALCLLNAALARQSIRAGGGSLKAHLTNAEGGNTVA